MGEARVQLSIRNSYLVPVWSPIVEDAVAGPGLVVPRAARQAAIAVRNTEALRRLALIAEGRHREWTGTE